eukprot:SM000040S14752  [mRNA]  locus=s40:109260:117320:+ [translate_table: standard]
MPVAAPCELHYGAARASLRCGEAALPLPSPAWPTAWSRLEWWRLCKRKPCAARAFDTSSRLPASGTGHEHALRPLPPSEWTGRSRVGEMVGPGLLAEDEEGQDADVLEEVEEEGDDEGGRAAQPERVMGEGFAFAGAAEPTDAEHRGTSHWSGEEHKLSGAVSEKGSMVDRVYDLRSRYQSGEAASISSQDVASLYDFPIDKFQRLAIKAFLKASSLVVCAPTSSGKTLIAEGAAAVTLARGKRLFYTTPLKALSNQKLREFRVKFGEANVGLLTGDAAVNRDAPVLVMTTEILRNMLYSSVGILEEGSRLMDVDAIVLDEVHYLSDISRGTVWEETIIYCPKDVLLICLSATVANADELAGWIRQVHGPTELVTSNWRPVPLSWHFSMRNAMVPLLNEQGSAINRCLLPKSKQVFQESAPWEEWFPETAKPQGGRRARGASTGNGRSGRRKEGRRGGSDNFSSWLSPEEMQMLRRRQVPQLRDTLLQLQQGDMLPAIWFVFSRRGCDSAVFLLDDVQLLSTHEVAQVKTAVDVFREQYPEAVRESHVASLYRGLASHHAGCLPAWKSFVEELYQRGLIKVVFATETLAAGINMPARSTVLSSLSKRGDSGHALLSANAMLQMSGRAGRRGIDLQGHVVVVQTPFEGPEECVDLLFAGPDPLVSQFTATYGMVLNLLGGSRGRPHDNSQEAVKEPQIARSTGGDLESTSVRRGRTMDEARALVERSFGNYVGSEVMAEARKQLAKFDEDIARVSEELNEEEEARMAELNGNMQAWKQYEEQRELLRVEKRKMKELKSLASALRVAQLAPLLNEELSSPQEGPPLAIRLVYQDARRGEDRALTALLVNFLQEPPTIADDAEDDEDGMEGGSEVHVQPPAFPKEGPMSSGAQRTLEASYYVALGADNCWYAVTAAAIASVHLTGPDIRRDSLESLKEKAPLAPGEWQKVGSTADGTLSTVFTAEGYRDTWIWSARLPLVADLQRLMLSKETAEQIEAEEKVAEQRNYVSRIRKRVKLTDGYKLHCQLVEQNKRREEKLRKLRSKADRLRERIASMQPTGWQEFVQVVNVLRKAGAIDLDSHALLPLGATAAAIRGVNELWMALAFRDEKLATMTPPQMASVCAALVSEGIKVRPEAKTSAIYSPSPEVMDMLDSIEDCRQWLLELQFEEGVGIPAELDPQFTGMVEAWASGVSWRELMCDCGLDEGDVARVLRRTIDALAQIPYLPHIDPAVARTARQAARTMDRAPISELIA